MAVEVSLRLRRSLEFMANFAGADQDAIGLVGVPIWNHRRSCGSQSSMGRAGVGVAEHAFGGEHRSTLAPFARAWRPQHVEIVGRVGGWQIWKLSRRECSSVRCGRWSARDLASWPWGRSMTRPESRSHFHRRRDELIMTIWATLASRQNWASKGPSLGVSRL